MIHAIPPFIGYCFTPIRIKVYEGLGPTSHLYKTHAIFKNHQWIYDHIWTSYLKQSETYTQVVYVLKNVLPHIFVWMYTPLGI